MANVDKTAPTALRQTEKEEVESSLNPVTQQAIEDAKSGNTLKCNSFEEYLELVK